MFHTKGHFGPGAEFFNGIGRRLPFAGIAKAIDCVTVTKGWSRPEAVIQVSCRERPLPDRKADITYEEIIVRRSNRFACPLSLAQADVGWVAPPSRLVAKTRHTLSGCILTAVEQCRNTQGLTLGVAVTGLGLLTLRNYLGRRSMHSRCWTVPLPQPFR